MFSETIHGMQYKNCVKETDKNHILESNYYIKDVILIHYFQAHKWSHLIPSSNNAAFTVSK